MRKLRTPTIDQRIAFFAKRPYYNEWKIAVETAGMCRNPVHIRPVIDGEPLGSEGLAMTTYRNTYSMRCLSRRVGVCPSCSMLYKIDVDLLAELGLNGVYETHQKWFVTLTAPSFGLVHSAHMRKAKPAKNGKKAQPAKPARCHGGPNRYCEHSTKISCGQIHGKDDAIVATPMCPLCYETAGQVLWNALFGKGWHGFEATYLHRRLAKAVGLTEAEFRSKVKIDYFKTVEPQRRGAMHPHAIIRLDDPDDPERKARASVTDEQFERAVRMAARDAKFTQIFKLSPVSEDDYRAGVLTGTGDWEDPGAKTHEFSFGSEIDVTPVTPDNVHWIAEYVAKYATKSASESAGFDKRFRSRAQIEQIDGHWWHKQLALTCWDLGADPRYKDLKLRNWAHNFGYRGHFLTKTRKYSTTFGELRHLRALYAAERAANDPDYHQNLNIPSSLFGREDVKWAYLRYGWLRQIDAFEVQDLYDARQEAIEMDRQERWDERARAE